MTDYAEGLGSFPIGGFPDADSLSVGDPLAGLLSDPTAARTFLLRGRPGAPAGLALHNPTLDTMYRVDFGLISDVGPYSSATFEVLVYQTGILMGKALVGDVSEHMWTVQGDATSLIVGISDGTHNASISGSTVPYQDGNCHRISLVFDRAASLATLYVDGDILGTANIATIGNIANSYHLCVGSLQNLAPTIPNCRAADFRVFSYARSQKEITDCAFTKLSPADAARCSVYALFDEGSGSTVADLSSNHFSGTVYRGGTTTPDATRWLPSIGTVAVDLSSDGYVTAAADSPPSRLFRGALAQPYTLNVNLPTPQLAGGASIGVGQPVIDNPDALRDGEALLDWLGAASDVYVGRRSDPLTLFTRIFHGYGAGVRENVNTWTLLHRDARYKLTKRLQQNRYKGLGAAIRFDGANGYASAAVPEPAGTVSIMAKVRQMTSAAGLYTIANYSVASSAASRVLRVNNLSPRFSVRNDASTLFEVTATSTLTVGTSYFVTGVLDVGAMLIHIYVDGVEAATPVAVTGTFNTTTTNFAVGRIADAATQYWNGDIDEVSVWSIALTQQQIVDSLGQPATGAETGLLHVWHFDEGSGSTASDSAPSGAVNLTINGILGTQSIWVGSLEGDSSIIGKVKPLGFGICRQVEAVCVDAQNLIYQVHDGSLQSIDAVRIGCDPQILGTDRADPYAGTPAGGHYDSCKVAGLIRLGTAPGNMKVTVDYHGDNSGPLGYQETAAGIHRKIITQWGGFADPAELDVSTYTALAALQPGSVGYYFPTDINVDAALDKVMSGINAWWTPNRVGWSTLGRIDAPEGLTPTVAITQDDVVDPDNGGQFEPTPVSVRVSAVIVGYRPYGVKMGPTEIAGSVALAARNDFGQQYRYTPAAVDPNASPFADTVTILTNLDNYADAVAESKRLLAMLKVDRKTYPVVLDSGILSYFIGTVFNLTHPRYELPWGKNMIVVGLSENMGDAAQQTPDTLQLVLYG